jgi:hypothetical protein
VIHNQANNAAAGGLAAAIQGIGVANVNPGMIGQIYNPAAYDPFPPTPWTMLYHASVEKVENGFILKVTHNQGDMPKMYVAHDAEELKDLFIAAMVAERVSK